MMINTYKIVISFVLLLCFSVVAYAQKTSEPNFYKDEANFRKNKSNLTEREVKYLNRWEWYWRTRVDEHGSYTRGSEELYKFLQEKSKHKKESNGSYTKSTSDIWTSIGPFLPIGGTKSSKGIGRIESAWVDPDNNKNIYIGGDSGGLWKSTNGGQTYICCTDDIPGIGVYDIDVIKGAGLNETDIIYICTGIWGNGSVHNGGYSMGILKSLDGGASFYAPKMPYSKERILMRQMIIHPTKPYIQFAISYKHIFKSMDTGNTWEEITNNCWNEGQRFFDIRFHPTNPNIIYIAGDNTLIRTDNADVLNQSITWNDISGGFKNLPAEYRMAIAVSALEPNSLFAICQYNIPSATYCKQKYYYEKSTNLGNSWTQLCEPSLNCWGPCLGIEIAPDDVNKIYIRDVELFESQWNSGAVTFHPVTDWSSLKSTNYVHADIRELIFIENSSNNYDLFVASDGGFSKSTDGGATWGDISSNLSLNQFYDIGISQTNPIKIVGGTHDCGTYKYENGAWDVVYGGDGGTSIISHANDDVSVITCNGTPLITKNNFIGSIPGFAPNLGGFNPPIIQHPHKENTYFTQKYIIIQPKINERFKVIKTDDAGASWDTLNPFCDPDRWTVISALEINESNPNYFYFSGFNGGGTDHDPYGVIWKSTDYGNNWIHIQNNMGPAVNANTVTDIVSHPYNPDKIWVSFGGFTDLGKVYTSPDAGETWLNISYGLANFPVQCLAYDKVNHCLYAGTDLGVYYLPLMNSNSFKPLRFWSRYGDNLPYVIVSDIEINYKTNELIVATYGRGVWRAPLHCPTPEGHISKAVDYSEKRFANSIETWGLLKEGRYVDYRVTSVLHIKSDFHVAKGATFHGLANDCHSSILKSVYKNDIDNQSTHTSINALELETEEENGFVAVYPNPVVNSLNVSIPNNTQVVHVYLLNMDGQMLLSTKRHAPDFSINMGDFSAGVYILKLNYNNRIEEYKIVKN